MPNINNMKIISMKTIIAPTDFSPISINAVNYAADMACAVNANLLLVHIYMVPGIYGELPYTIQGPESASLISDTEKTIQQLKTELEKRTNGNINISTEVILATSVLTELEDFCKPRKPYAVVMGTQGSTAMERFFFGSNTIGAMKHLAWPLVIVPAEAKFTEIKRIGLACDLKDVDKSMPFSEIRSLVKQFDAMLYILHINAENEKGFTIEKTIESRSLQEMLQDLQPVYRFLDDDDIENALEKFAETNQLDLLLVVPKKHSIIDKLFHKSHSKKMVLHTHVPLMAIHN